MNVGGELALSGDERSQRSAFVTQRFVGFGFGESSFGAPARDAEIGESIARFPSEPQRVVELVASDRVATATLHGAQTSLRVTRQRREELERTIRFFMTVRELVRACGDLEQ